MTRDHPLIDATGEPSGGRRRNPVLDADFPDPSVLAEPVDGWWYAYASQHTTVERWCHVQVARSRDLHEWELLGEALERPSWSRDQWECAWAPHVVARDGRFVMYYSAMPDDRSGMWLGAAVADRPEGPFRDVGEPLVRDRGYVAIDPMAFRDPADGRWWLYWGGDYAPIRAAELAPDGLSLAPGASAVDLVAPDPARPYERLVEGAFVVARDGGYVLLYSGDVFGGETPRYAVLVARGPTPLGPFTRLADARPNPSRSSAILEASDRWLGPGHCSVVTDADGADWLAYHAVDVDDPWQRGERFVRRKFCLDQLIWTDGWPSIAGGLPGN